MLIEIIGIPGSGKSTLIKALKQEPGLRSAFSTWQGVRVKAMRSFVSNTETSQKQWTAFPRSILWSIPWLNDYFANCIFHRFIKQDPMVYEGSWGKLAKLLIEGVTHRVDIKPDHVPYYISWELEKLVAANLSGHFCNIHNKNIILDEGVLSAMNTLSIIKDLFNPSLMPDAVIFVSTTPQDALTGISERKKKGRVNRSQQKKNDTEILEFITQKHQKYLDFVKQLSSLNIPVLDYNYKNDSFQSLVNQLKELLYND